MLDTPHYSIEVQNLSCFHNEQLLFSEINFSVNSGEVLLDKSLEQTPNNRDG